MQTNSLMQILNSFAPLLLITFIFIIFVFRPQYKKANEHKKMLANLKNDDEVITSSGLIGKITKIENNIVHLKISENQEIKIIKSAILEIYDETKFLGKQ